jgi:hypothetical protein
MFCKHCGASIGIDFREVYAPKHIYGISVSDLRLYAWNIKMKAEDLKQVRTFFDVDLDSLTYRKLDGRNKVPPTGDLSGQYWDEEAHKLK